MIKKIINYIKYIRFCNKYWKELKTKRMEKAEKEFYNQFKEVAI